MNMANLCKEEQDKQMNLTHISRALVKVYTYCLKH